MASALVIGILTLMPTPTGGDSTVGRSLLLTDIVLNVLLFMPFGGGLALTGRTPVRAALVAATVSVMIELCQLSWIPGRDASIHDVVTNTLGGGLGAIIVAGWGRRAAVWRRLGPAIAAAAVVAWNVGGLLIAPGVPSGNGWYGQWAHEFARTTLFPGRIVSFQVRGLPIPDGPIAATDALQAKLGATDTVRAVVVLTTGRAFTGRAQLAGVVSPTGGDFLGLWQQGQSVLGFPRLRMTNAGLRGPVFIVREAIPEQAGDSVTVSMEWSLRHVTLSAESRIGRKEQRLTLTPEVFWAGFLPFDYDLGGTNWWISVLAAGAVFFPIGLGLTRRAAWGLGVSVLTLAGGPFLLGCAASSALTWVLGLAAATCGILLGRLLRF
ncbi:MAG: VanZ family protein [Gemmatimonadales bacterium]|nr:VanZ family protein [Gemmatimonadales bacterium]